MKTPQISAQEYYQYYKQYIDLVDDLSLIEALEVGMDKTIRFFESLPEEKLHYQYAEEKWTPKEILLHLIDTERVFSYRALYFARNENSSLEGFDENIFGKNCNANPRSLQDLLEEYRTVRKATLSLFKSFNADILKHGGTANHSLLSVRATGFIICGHEIHHCKVITSRYLN